MTTEKQWKAAWPALSSLRTDLKLDRFLQSREEIMSRGYQLFGLDSNDNIVCVAGLMIYPHVTRGSDCWVYDLATLETERSKGLGKQMLRFLEMFAKDNGCSRISLHSRLHREDAHRFYEERARWKRSAYVFSKEL